MKDADCTMKLLLFFQGILNAVVQKSFLPPTAAKFHIETVLDSLILHRKINESSTVSNDYLAGSAENKLFTQPPTK